MKTSRALALALVPIAATLACGTATTTANGASGGIAGDATVTVASPGTGAGRESAAPTGTSTGNATSTENAAATGNPAAKPGEPAPPTSTKPVTVSRHPAKPPTVTGVRFARHAGFDRVVIDLSGAMPGYSVAWTDKLIHDASGDPVGLAGGAYLQVRITPAAAHNRAGDPTWTGPRQVAANLPNVRHIVNNGDFEGIVSVGLVLARKAGFRVLAQSGPSRIVIDVAH
ncbi:AMIN-like domain-containing (lipo)protein [Microtetraspora malaysiensis]|uniref:AMIN-like domain-containing (lipo)protein n=1 Tax=Microtetraspora malaysiensis TaxID=161358 RepID=UPI003D89CE2E